MNIFYFLNSKTYHILGDPGRSIAGPPGTDGYPGPSGLPGAKGKYTSIEDRNTLIIFIF